MVTKNKNNIISQTIEAKDIDSKVSAINDGNKISKSAWRVLAFVFAAWIIDAADGTIYSLTLPSIRTEFGFSLAQMGGVASIFLCGTVLGTVLIPILAQKKGRRVGMIACVSIYSVFTGLVGIAQSLPQIAIGRFFTGTGTGAEWPIGASYLSEVVPPKKRGWAMGIMQAGYPVGYFIAGGLFMIAMNLHWGWRSCYFIMIIPALLCIPILRILKESPTWLKNKEEMAKGNIAGVKVKKKESYSELFKPQYRKNTIIATILHICNAVFSWALVVWFPSAMMIDFHLSSVTAAGIVMFGWGCGVFGYLAAGKLADVLGRKKALSLYMCLGLIAVSLLNYLHTLSTVPITYFYFCAALVGCSLGVAGIVMAYTSEIFPSHVRTLGLGFASAVGKVAAVFIPIVLGVIATASSITFGLLCSTIISMIMIPTIMFGPETANRILDEIVD